MNLRESPHRIRIAALLAACLLPSSGHAASHPVAILCDASYYPYSYAVHGEAMGIDVEIIRHAAARLDGYDVRLHPVPWKRGLRELEAGRIFGLFPAYDRPAERPWMDCSLALKDEAVSLWWRAGTRPGRFPEDYLGRPFGITAGYVALNPYRAKVKVVEVPDIRAGIGMLLLGRIDGYANDELAVELELADLKRIGKAPPGAKLVKGRNLFTEPGCLGLTKDPVAYPHLADFKARFGAILADMRRNGEFERIARDFMANHPDDPNRP
jgi:polar amino acid transport system substrate-binding protein